MYARRVSMKLKPDTAAEFTKHLNDQVIPLLRKQPGFRNELACAAEDGESAFGISFWDSKDNADAYERESYPQVVKMLAGVVEGTPRVRGFHVSTSTFVDPSSPTDSH